MIKCWKHTRNLFKSEISSNFLRLVSMSRSRIRSNSRGTATTSREISGEHSRGVVDREAFNTQNHSSIENGTSLESSKLLEFQGYSKTNDPSVSTRKYVRFHAESQSARVIFVLRRPLFADRRKCLKISVCPGLETVSNNGNMPYPMAHVVADRAMFVFIDPIEPLDLPA